MRKEKFLSMGLACIMLITSLTGCGKDKENVIVDPPSEITAENSPETPGNQETTENVDTEETTTEQTTENETSNEENSGTVAEVLSQQFKEEAASDTDINKIAENLSKNKVFNEVAMMTMEVVPGYLNGFEDEINGFTKGVTFSPMIGTVPFVGYVFETDDAETLVKTLEEKARLDWNICTTADEMKTEISGNMVMFVMSPKSFQN